MKTALASLLLTCSCLSGCAGHASTSADQARLQGAWLAHSESQNGQSKDVVFQYVFSGTTLTFTDETGQQMKYSFAVVADNTPKLLAIWPEGSPADTPPVRVAYELSGDSLTIVVAPPGSIPADISDKHDQELISCRRKSP